MTDRAQDTEAIRAAAEALLQYVSDGTDGLMTPQFIHLADASEVLAVVSAVPGLVARLEAVERERDEAGERLAKVLVGTERPAEAVFDQFREIYGLPTEDEARGETGCKGLWPGCMDDGCNWPNGPCAAPGETEQTP